MVLKSIPSTASNTKYNHFEFVVLPFGIANASAVFMDPRNKVFSTELDKFVSTYLDNILVHSKTFKEHLQHLAMVLERLRAESLYEKLSKCSFEANEVKYHENLISGMSVSVGQQKHFQALEKWPGPRRKQDIHSFLGFVNYCQRMFFHRSGIVKPLTQVTKNVPFQWNRAAETSFNELREAPVTAPILVTFDVRKETYVTCDASKYAIGAILEQKHGNRFYPMTYVSRTLNITKQNYAAIK